jgi:hypothetical protein
MYETGRHRGCGIRAGVGGRCWGLTSPILLWSLLTACLQPCNSWAAPFAGGTGVAGDAYQIATAAELLSMGSDPAMLSRHFVLVADIDLDPNLPGGVIFSEPPIAPSAQAPFEGSLDGAGHAIRNLTLARTEDMEDRDAALLGYVAAGGVVRNLVLEEVRIANPFDYVAGLVAHNAGDLLHCTVTGSVSGGPFTGGLVADNSGSLLLCSAACDVAGPDTLGGLVAVNTGTLDSCHSSGSVTGDSSVGGVVGENDGVLSSCYVTGPVAGQAMVGGLVGNNETSGCLACCYVTGPVSGVSNVGGLMGTGTGTITACYSTSTVTALIGPIGGLTGASGQIASSYFLAQPNIKPRKGYGVARTAAQMTQQESFVGFDFWGTTSDGFNDEWFMPPNASPILAWQTDLTGLAAIPDVKGLALQDARQVLSQAGFVAPAQVSADHSRSVPKDCVLRTYPPAYALPGGEVELTLSLGPDVYDWTTNPGEGTAARPYEIQSARQLEDLAYRPELWGRCFALTADVNMTGRTYSTALIAPDVDGATAGFQGIGFAGVFDGRGFKIQNLQVVSRTNDYLGLFGLIAKDAAVRGITLENVMIRGGFGTTGNDSSGTGSDYVGSVAGYNAGTISSCSASGSVFGHAQVGEVAGDGPGKVVDCQATGIHLSHRSPAPAGLPPSL